VRGNLFSMVICPACGSAKIRNDYRPAPIFLRVLLIRALLCDNCNRQFKAFSPRAPGARQSSRARKKADTFVTASTRTDRSGLTTRSGTRAESRRASPDQIGQIGQIGQTGQTWQFRPPPGEPAARRTEITRIGTDAAKVCPECGSSRIRRRPRGAIERMVLSITDHRAYVCQECKHSFYARSGERSG